MTRDGKFDVAGWDDRGRRYDPAKGPNGGASPAHGPEAEPSLLGSLAILVLGAVLVFAAFLWVTARVEALDHELDLCAKALVADPTACIPVPTTEGNPTR